MLLLIKQCTSALLVCYMSLQMFNMMKITAYGENLFHSTSRILFWNSFIRSTYIHGLVFGTMELDWILGNLYRTWNGFGCFSMVSALKLLNVVYVISGRDRLTVCLL